MRENGVKSGKITAPESPNIYYLPCDKTFLLVPSSRSSDKVKVEYEGHNLKKWPLRGHLCFTNTSIFFLCVFFFFLIEKKIKLKTTCIWLSQSEVVVTLESRKG